MVFIGVYTVFNGFYMGFTHVLYELYRGSIWSYRSFIGVLFGFIVIFYG